MSAEGWRPPPLRECDTVSCADGRTVPAQTSIPNVLGLTGATDPRRFRAQFAAIWADYLRANFRNPEFVAVMFGVRYQTALNWWIGDNRPSGDIVALAGPAFAAYLAARLG